MILKIKFPILSKIALLASIAFISTGALNKTYSDGLPGEYILSDQWRSFSKFYSPSTNPAFMMEYLYTSIRGVVALSGDDASKLWETGVVVPIGFYNTAGFSILGENGHVVKNSSIDAPDAVIGTSKNSNYLFTLSYATNPWRKLNVGVNLNLAYQGNFGADPSLNMGIDLGLSYRLLLHPVFGCHIVGVNFQNLWAPKLSDIDKLPVSAKTYLRSTVFDNKLELDMELNFTDFFTKPESFMDGKHLEWNFFLQGGFWVLPFAAVRAFTEVGDVKGKNSLEFWGAAIELNVPQVNGGRDFSILYQFKEEISNELLGTHSLYLRADVGRSREEVRNRRVARLVNLNSSELYNKAMKLYYKKDYWGAYFIYARILAEYPDFHKNDLVTHYAGSSLEELDMREESIKLYEDVKKDYSLSYITPHSDLGIMRVQYRQGNYNLVENQYIELNRQGVPDSIRAHGAYIMGETELRRGEYAKAIQYFDMVPEGHPVYVFAQHSAATAFALMDSDMQDVVSRLDNCVSANVTSEAEREIVNRSLVLLGYVYYEDNSLSKAVSALRMVPEGSYYFEDAMLGLGWTAIKARQWKDCIDAGTKLSQKSNRFVTQGEAALLIAYGHILEKNYVQAQTILEPVLQKFDAHNILTEDSINTEKMRYESDRMSYAFLAEKVVNTARKGQSVKQQVVDSLHNDQVKRKEKIDQYLVFAEESKRTRFFERSIKTVRDEIEYALVTVQKMVSKSSIIKEQEKLQNKDNDITNEIEKLKEEMQNLENSGE